MTPFLMIICIEHYWAIQTRKDDPFPLPNAPYHMKNEINDFSTISMKNWMKGKMRFLPMEMDISP